MPSNSLHADRYGASRLAGGASFAVSERVETFIRSLHDYEQSGTMNDLLRLFAGDCELEHKPREELYRGQDGAAQFWTTYRSQFHDIRTLFTHSLESGPYVVLEWFSDGKLAAGRDIRYSGVTILEFAADERVQRLRTYYDSAVFAAVKDHHAH
jgi:ketosteroid isomerase-like protein